MRLDLPFYQNDGVGVQCMQVAMRTALKHFLDKEYSLEQLDDLTGRSGEKWTFTCQIVAALYDLGLDVKFFSKEPLEVALEGEDYLRKAWGKDFDHLIQYANVDAFVSATKKLLTYDLFEQKNLSINTLCQHLDQGHIPLVLFDYNVAHKIEGPYQGHFVVLTGYDDSHFYYHESGPKDPEANKKVDKDIFYKAMSVQATDSDCVIVFGKR